MLSIKQILAFAYPKTIVNLPILKGFSILMMLNANHNDAV